MSAFENSPVIISTNKSGFFCKSAWMLSQVRRGFVEISSVLPAITFEKKQLIWTGVVDETF